MFRASYKSESNADELNAVYMEQEEGITYADKHLILNTAGDADDIVTALNKQKIVHYLNLEGNALGINAANAIGRALTKHPELRKVLWRNMFTGRNKCEIPEVLKLLSRGLIIASATLTVIDVSDNALGANGLIGLNDVLRSRACYTLQELHVDNCVLESHGGSMLSTALLACHSQSHAAGTPLQLKVFTAGGNRFDVDGIKSLAKFFTALTSLEVVHLPRNDINPVGITVLVESLKGQRSLRDLNLKDNNITDGGVKSLAAYLAETQNLRTLNLANCLLATYGAFTLVNCLKHCELLETIDLSCNDINLVGSMSLIRALAQKPQLQLLNLDGNFFDYWGSKILRQKWQDIAFNPNALQSFERDDLKKAGSPSPGSYSTSVNAANAGSSEALEEATDDTSISDQRNYAQSMAENAAAANDFNSTEHQLEFETEPTDYDDHDDDDGAVEENYQNSEDTEDAADYNYDNNNVIEEEDADADADADNNDDDDETLCADMSTLCDEEAEDDTLYLSILSSVETNVASQPTSTTLLAVDCCLVEPADDAAAGAAAAATATAAADPPNSTDQTSAALNSPTTTVSVTDAALDFCLSCQPCTLQMFEALPFKNKLQSFMQVINQFTDDDHLLLLVFTALKCAHLALVSEEALELAVAMYQQLFNYAVESKQEKRVLDYILKQLKLLRSEEKFETSYDIISCRYALKQLLMRPNQMSELISKTLQAFI